MTNQQPKPLRLADQLDTEWSGVLLPTRQSAAAELRRLHAENEALKAQLQQQDTVPYKVGQKVKVTRLTYGGAVYGKNREIINGNEPPHKSVRVGYIEGVEQELGVGAVIVKCKSDDKFLHDFNFYPHQNGSDQIVEILSHPEQEPMKFLAQASRYKVSHTSDGVSITGLPVDLVGQWVALVDATDNKHLQYTTPQEPQQKQPTVSKEIH